MIAQSRTGTVTEDPTKIAALGTVFSIRSMFYPPMIPVGAGDLTEWDYFGTSLIGLNFANGSTARTDGSAILVGPGVALAARHVLDPVIDDLLASRISILAFSVIEAGMMLWQVHQVVLAENDVAILRLNAASSIPERGLEVGTLTTRLPIIGEPVMIAGLRGEGANAIDRTFPVQVRIGVGEVTALYPAGRDRVMLPNPCIEVKCLTVGGMSGGPAFDKDGNLLGVLTSSFDDQEGPSYVSLWWPQAARKIDTCWPSGIVTLPTTLLEMQRAGAVSIIGRDALALQSDDVLTYVP